MEVPHSDSLRAFLPTEWLIGQQWCVEFTFEQRIDPLLGNALASLELNAQKRHELWQFEVSHHEVVEGTEYLIIRASPVEGITQSFDAKVIDLYFDEHSRTIHSFKVRESPLLGDEHIEYMKNPWGVQSFFLTDPRYIILDWPKIDVEQKGIGIGSLSFEQKIVTSEKGLTVMFGGASATTVLTWEKGKSWWSMADKIIKQGNATLHITGKLITPEEMAKTAESEENEIDD